MPRETLVNLSADQRHHLNNYLSGKANAAKYDAEAKQYKKIEQALAPYENAAKVGVVAGNVAQVGLAVTATAASGALGSTAAIAAKRAESAVIPRAGEYVASKLAQRELEKEVGSAAGRLAQRQATSVLLRGGQSYNSYSTLKKALGPAGDGKAWHHIVEQSQSNTQGIEAIQNTKNVIALDKNIHEKISAYYSSKRPFTNGQTVREWLRPQSFDEQYQFGMDVIRQVGGR